MLLRDLSHVLLIITDVFIILNRLIIGCEPLIVSGFINKAWWNISILIGQSVVVAIFALIEGHDRWWVCHEVVQHLLGNQRLVLLNTIIRG